MGIKSQLRGFIRAFRTDSGKKPGRHRGHALARTFKDGTTIAGGNVPSASMGSGVGQRQGDLFAEASERYDASFDED